VQLSEYSLDRLRDDGEFILYRGHSKQAEIPSVLVLAPVATRPSPETLKRIDHEYSLKSELDSDWAVRPLDRSAHGDQTALILEDAGGETLDGFLSSPMEMTQFLGFAVGLAAALNGLHERKLIHKDVKPADILVNSATGQVRLMGFGIATRLRREHQAPEPAEFIAGTLPYMAPEQTGRMNRSIDSRSDLYALGVTLYVMLTGNLPFTASDPIEWVHCHIAKRPIPPHERVKTVPACVSAIVMKLLAKTPEERYQTASGVENDLRRCVVEWEAHTHIADFSPGQHDVPDRLLIPEKLYGREREIEALLNAFDRVVAGGSPELVLVSATTSSMRTITSPIWRAFHVHRSIRTSLEARWAAPSSGTSCSSLSTIKVPGRVLGRAVRSPTSLPHPSGPAIFRAAPSRSSIPRPGTSARTAM
jgi:serine/threonine protein kinase